MLDDVLEQLDHVRRSGDGWTARCPAHDDSNPSLSITESEGRLLLYCHAGCDYRDIVKHLNLPEEDHEPIVYTYTDEVGVPLYEVVRFPGKDFKQRQPNGEWGIKGIRRVPYRLPTVLLASEVYVVEGEKDVERLLENETVATCNMGGAGHWDESWGSIFRDRDIKIVADKDVTGRKHATEVRDALLPHAASVVVLEARSGKDVSDHLAAGFTLDELVQTWPRQHSWRPRVLSTEEKIEIPQPTIGGLVYPGHRHLVSGEPETLKSWLALCLGSDEMKMGNPVFWFDFGEMGQSGVMERLWALGIRDFGYFHYFEPEERPDEELLADVSRETESILPSLVVIDSYTGGLELLGLDPNVGRDIQALQRRLVAPLQKHGAAVILIDHVAKGVEGKGRYSIGSERKLGGVDVHLKLTSQHMLRRGGKGWAEISVQKDRPGCLDRFNPTRLFIESNPQTGEITWEIQKTQPGEAPPVTWDG